MSLLLLKTFPGHVFGSASKANLQGVLPALVSVAELALVLCEFDGTVLASGGVRSQAQADDNQRRGVGISNSRHLRQPDGWGHAIDLVALTAGKVDWNNLPAFREMARCVKLASAILEVPIRQGADWNMNGVLGESGTKEWDWPHFEDPLPVHMARAEAEMRRHRAMLIAASYDMDPRSYGVAA